MAGNLDPLIQPLLTDFYELNMAYAYWKSGKTEDKAIFDLFFRKNPFKGEFTIFGGLEEVLKYVRDFHYSESDIDYLRTHMHSSVDPEFFTYLSTLDTGGLTLSAIDEGSVVFPRVPLIRVEGPLIMAQLLESTLLNLVNFASLMTTNAARFRLAAGTSAQLIEFGLRRAQGPNGALSASKYSFMGGFDSTSNVLAGKLFGIPIKGTHAHAFISSFLGCEELKVRTLQRNPNSITPTAADTIDFLACCQNWKTQLASLLDIPEKEASDGEFASFVAFAIAFPHTFVALVDTYDTMRSGLLNFCAVAMALNELGYRPLGIRLDSGDLAQLSKAARKIFLQIADSFTADCFRHLIIVASNDVNEEVLYSLNEQGHEINAFGVGTHLVTCQKQPALGGVYKLVEINSKARIKLSEEMQKVTLPGRKNAYRLYGVDGYALLDLLTNFDEPAPKPGDKVLCLHPFQESKRVCVTPTKVEPLYQVLYKNGELLKEIPSLKERREAVTLSMNTIKKEHKRYLNPTHYKVSVSQALYKCIHKIWQETAPIPQLH